MSFSLKILPPAEYDLRYIYEYFSSTLMNDELAKCIHTKLKTAVYSLREMPFRYAVYECEPWKSRGIRKMPVENFLIFYVVENATSSVHILRVLYGGRNLEECLQEDPFP